MSASTRNDSGPHRGQSPTAATVVTSAREDVTATVGAIRSAAGEVGVRMPELLDRVRVGAAEGARTVDAWPEATRHLVAAFSVGVGAGLGMAGAPRLLVGGALLPAIAVMLTAMRRESTRPA